MDLDPGQDPQQQQETFMPQAPKPIVQLSKDVINQIAAAEIIHRPANAIKELIENSLDAGSSSIKVTVKDGGLKLLQIADNGHGINKSDLPLLCTRYATSKLSKFSDLQALSTYGFRGEALASISYCAHVDVVTKTKTDNCGWKAHYSDGELIPPKPGVGPEPRPAAANDGTVITAEDLFYNMPLRKRAFKSPSEEYNRILEVITKYAIHNPHCGWVCKKAGSSLPDISTPPNSTSKSNISLLYGPSLATKLLEVPQTTLEPAAKLGAECRGWVSNANSNWARKGGWLLFINHRLVDSNKIRKAIESLYTAYLPKGSSPFVYLSLEIDPTKVDVNVHPTKSEVHFLNEDEMIEAIVGTIQKALIDANVSRSFSVQTLLPGAAPINPHPEKRGEPSSLRSKPAPNYKVRMDPTNRTLESMITQQNPSQKTGFILTQPQSQSQTQRIRDEGEERARKRRGVDDDGTLGFVDAEDGEAGDEFGGEDGEGQGGKGGWNTSSDIGESSCEFDSIKQLRGEVKKTGNAEVNEIIRKHAFVGVVDYDLSLSAIQQSTKLYLVNHTALAEEHFYQLGLRQFGGFSRLKLEPAPLLRDLIELAVEDEEGVKENGHDPVQIIARIVNLLMDKREMMDEYFSLRIGDTGAVESIPMVLKGYTPNLDRLPHFLLCLETQVNWKEEKECFATFLRELAFFYAPHPFQPSSSNPSDGIEEKDEILKSTTTPQERDHDLWQITNILFPSFRRYTNWPKDVILGREVLQVANLPDLFRVFERC